VAGEALVAERELEAVVRGLEPGLLQGALELAGVAAQHIEGLRALDEEARGDMAVAVDVEAHVDAAELRRVEPDLEAAAPRLRAGHDLDREAGDRHCRIGRGPGRGGRRGRRARCSGIAEAVGRLKEIDQLDSVEVRPGVRRGFTGLQVGPWTRSVARPWRLPSACRTRMDVGGRCLVRRCGVRQGTSFAALDFGCIRWRWRRSIAVRRRYGGRVRSVGIGRASLFFVPGGCRLSWQESIAVRRCRAGRLRSAGVGRASLFLLAGGTRFGWRNSIAIRRCRASRVRSAAIGRARFLLAGGTRFGWRSSVCVRRCRAFRRRSVGIGRAGIFCPAGGDRFGWFD
jgi:hypothetical protein